MKKLLLTLVILLAGAGVGGGAAIGARHLAGPPKPVVKAEQPPVFVRASKILAPLVLADGRLAGYVTFDAALQVPADQAAIVTAKLPMLFHAINMRTYHTPLATGPDGMLPDINGLRAVVMAASAEAFGRAVVRRAAITRAESA